MNRKDAKRIAETITNDQLAMMFDKAKDGISNWEAVSAVNKGMTKGTAWNILYRAFDPSKKTHGLSKVNMIREFGDFIKDQFKEPQKKPIKMVSLYHQEPNFGATGAQS